MSETKSPIDLGVIVSKAKGFLRGNVQIKAPNHVEHVSEDIFKNRVREIMRCKEDICYFAEKYFTIVSPAKGQHIIELYDKQKELIEFFKNTERAVCLASRQSGKTTCYSIYILWMICFHSDKKILICANKAQASFEFVGRIRLAYELLPNWLKPGVNSWNKSSLELANGSKVEGTATSADSSRGRSCNILVVDEMAFINPGICLEFWSSVYPIISSAKGTQVILVSTPNGTGNLYYDIWNKAQLGISEDGWKGFQFDWWDVPGRDEQWKRQTIESLNGDMTLFNQEFGNLFVGSSYTLIPGNKIEELKQIRKMNMREPKVVQMKEVTETKVEFEVYAPYKESHSYVIGADTADGIGSDFSTILVFDVTDTTNIELVLRYCSNQITTTTFAYVLNKIGVLYGSPPLAMENNGVGRGVVEALWTIYEYENMVYYKSQKGMVGIFSHNAVKVEACLWFRELMDNQNIRFTIRDGRLLEELEYFEKKIPSQKLIYKAADGKHDDLVMSMIWAMFVLHPQIIENYFNVVKYHKSGMGISKFPHSISKLNSGYYGGEDFYETRESNWGNAEAEEIRKRLEQAEKKFRGMSKTTGSTNLEDEDNSDGINNIDSEDEMPAVFVDGDI
ncbi:MAG TPA: terminase family protein [Saccharofermentans sp.]|nr:terminase family protein [Saccharofermentans sp.]